MIYNVDVGSHVFFFQAEDGIRDLVRSRGLGDVYKRQVQSSGFKVQSSVPGSEFRVLCVDSQSLIT